MSKVFVQNLGMIVTNKCNLNCVHCMRGCKNNKDMSTDVIKATLEQIDSIGNLAICGGEPTMALDVIEKMFNYIVDNNIVLQQVTLTINGTIYDENFLRLLDYINDYIADLNYENDVHFCISYDKYHNEEIKRLGLEKEFLENIRKYTESEYFYDFNKLKSNLLLFKEGNAENLDDNLTVNIKPMDIIVSYMGKFKKEDKKYTAIGPLITINTDGIITECDASIKHQEELYNYGNVLSDSIKEIALEQGRVVNSLKFYRETHKVIKKHLHYNS